MTIDWWAGAAGALLGALIGSCVPLLWSAWARRKERRGELIAMQAEMYHARRAMTALSAARPIVLAPLYHLPLTIFERALPKLIGEGLLTENEISGLVEYVMRAEELNRGLDLASAAAAGGEQAAMGAVSEQFTRNLGKVTHILNEKQERLGGLTVFDVAEAAIYRLAGSVPPAR
jgi:hypothetical protein